MRRSFIYISLNRFWNFPFLSRTEWVSHRDAGTYILSYPYHSVFRALSYPFTSLYPFNKEDLLYRRKSRLSCVPAFRGFMLFCLKLPVSHYIPTVSYRLFDKHVFMSFRFYAWKNPLYSLLWKVIFHSLCTVTLPFIPYKSVLSVTETGWNEYKKWIFCSNYYIMRIIICIFVARINKRSFGKVW